MFVSHNPMVVKRPGFNHSWSVREVRMIALDPVICRLGNYLKDRLEDCVGCWSEDDQEFLIEITGDFCDILGLDEADRLLVLARQLNLLEVNHDKNIS